MTSALQFRTVDDVQAAYELETAGYPADEAASLEALTFRLAQAPELFLGKQGAYAANDSAQLLGFITATLSDAETLTAKSMSSHVPNGTTVCVHSVCVAAEYRRQGIATALLRALEYRLREANDAPSPSERKRYCRIALLSHAQLVPLYEKAGYRLLGESAVAHGQLPWFELQLDL